MLPIQSLSELSMRVSAAFTPLFQRMNTLRKRTAGQNQPYTYINLSYITKCHRSQVPAFDQWCLRLISCQNGNLRWRNALSDEETCQAQGSFCFMFIGATSLHLHLPSVDKGLIMTSQRKAAKSSYCCLINIRKFWNATMCGPRSPVSASNKTRKKWEVFQNHPPLNFLGKWLQNGSKI